MVDPVHVVPQPRHDVAGAVRPVHGEAQHVLVHEQTHGALGPRVLRAVGAREVGRVGGEEEDREDAVHQHRQPVVPVLGVQVLERAAHEVGLVAKSVFKRWLRAVLGALGEGEFEVGVVRAHKERGGGHPQPHLHKRLAAGRGGEVAARVGEAEDDEREAHANLHARVHQTAAEEEGGEVLELLLLPGVERLGLSVLGERGLGLGAALAGAEGDHGLLGGLGGHDVGRGGGGHAWRGRGRDEGGGLLSVERSAGFRGGGGANSSLLR
mmetsp:Transcript_7106/g.19334  ORF Transcript_7106/g.19334 Transcript_7106/m.19334 type:complete len:267 (+) Transcript_7106:1209-2009(+)